MFCQGRPVNVHNSCCCSGLKRNRVFSIIIYPDEITSQSKLHERFELLTFGEDNAIEWFVELQEHFHAFFLAFDVERCDFRCIGRWR